MIKVLIAATWIVMLCVAVVVLLGLAVMFFVCFALDMMALFYGALIASGILGMFSFGVIFLISLIGKNR